MSDPYVREVGNVQDMDGGCCPIGVDYDSITVGCYRFAPAQFEEFAQAFVSAVWQAGQQKAAMDAEAGGCRVPHGPDMRCFDCATDAEMAAAIPPPPGVPDD